MTPAKAELQATRETVVASLRALVLGLVVTVPLVFDPRRGYEGGRPKYLLLVVGGLLAAVLLGICVLTRRHPLRCNWLAGPVLVLLACTALSTLASDHTRTAVFGFAGLRHGLLTTACLIILFFATALVVRLTGARQILEGMWFAAGGGVLLFGLGQLQDRVFSPEQGWNWARPGISPWTIGSTLGNPNHLSSFLAVLLPLGVLLSVSATGRRRTLSLVMVAVAVAQLAITSSRGGTLAAGAGLGLLAVLFRTELKARRALVIRLAAGGLVLALLVVLVFGRAGITKISPGSFFRTGPGSTLDLRLEAWGSAFRMAADRPVLGAGPDVFPVLFPAYASERFLRLYGPFTVANGAHNVFLDTAADTGLLGLATLTMLLAMAAYRLAQAWRRLPPTVENRDARLFLAATSAALVAYLVQANLNTDEVALSLCFWVLLGVGVGLSSAGPMLRRARR